MTPVLLKTPSGYVQQNPWLSVSNKQLELMGRYMAELGMTPASRSRVAALAAPGADPVTRVEMVIIGRDEDGNWCERPMPTGRIGSRPAQVDGLPEVQRIELDARL